MHRLLALPILFALAPLLALAAEPAPHARREPSPAERIAYGETDEFWKEYALVVAKVDDIQHRDEGEHLVVSVVKLSVLESVPARYAPGTSFSLTFEIDIRLIPVRDKPGYAIDLPVGTRVMLMAAEEKGRIVHALPRVAGPVFRRIDPQDLPHLLARPEAMRLDFRGYSSFAMLPGWQLGYPESQDAVVAETVALCRALSEPNPTRRLALTSTLLASKPSARTLPLLRRRLETTLETSLHDAQEANRLLKEAGKP